MYCLNTVNSLYVIYIFQSIAVVNYSICAIGSISYAGYQALNQSIGKDIVVTIFKRHILQCLAYILCNLYLFIGTFLAMFNT